MSVADKGKFDVLGQTKGRISKDFAWLVSNPCDVCPSTGAQIQDGEPGNILDPTGRPG